MKTMFCIVLGVLGAVEAPPEDSAPPAGTFDAASLEAYKREIARAESDLSTIIALENRQARIARYQEVLDKYPSYPSSVELELRIAAIWNSASPDGTPADTQKCIEVYESILKRYPPNERGMEEVMLSVAHRCKDVYPDRAKRYFEQIFVTYPDNDRMRLESYLGLGILARRASDKALAEEYFSQVLKYSPTKAKKTDTLSAIFIDGAQSNAAVELFAMLFDITLPPEEQKIVLDNILKRYPAIKYLARRTVEYTRADIEKRLEEKQKEDVENILSTPLSQTPSMPSPDKMPEPNASAAQAATIPRPIQFPKRDAALSWRGAVPAALGVVALVGVLAVVLARRRASRRSGHGE